MAYHDRPRRPRSHEIETASEKAFGQLIPDGWVVRPKSHDYGIDLEVEVFDDDGRTTGLVFLVQLKGTDDTGESVRVPIELGTLAYMEDLRLPVLVVRYRAPDAALFGRWAHTIDVPAGKRAQNSITVGFDAAHRLGADSPSEIAAVVNAYRETFIDRRLPLALALELSEDYFDSTAAGELQRALKANAARLSPLVRLDGGTRESRPVTRSALIVDAARIDILIVGRRVLVMETASRPTAADVMTALAMALSRGGFGADVAALLDGVIDDSQFADQDDVEVTRWRCLLAAGRTEDVLARLERFALRRYSTDSDDTAVAAHLPLLMGLARHDRSFARDRLVPTLDRLAAALVEHGQEVRAAAHVYNAANLLKSGERSGLREAVGRYRRAARLDPSYHRRGYWWAELAGMLFEARRYKASADCYEKAVSLGMRGCHLALTADAQWHCGRYRAALSNFEAYEAERRVSTDSDSSTGSAGWCLTRWALSSVVEVLGIESGPLQGGMDTYRGDDEPQELLTYLHEHGILHSRVWFNYGNAANGQGDQHGALIGFLMAALLVPADKESWGNALALAFSSSDGNLTGHLVEDVLFRHGSEFIDYFVESRIPGDDEEARLARREVRRGLMATMSARSVGEVPMEIRFNGAPAHSAGRPTIRVHES